MDRLDKIIGVYGLSNTSSVNVYDIIHGIEDTIIAGINGRVPEEYTIQYDEDGEPYFTMGEMDIYFNEIIRSNY